MEKAIAVRLFENKKNGSTYGKGLYRSAIFNASAELRDPHVKYLLDFYAIDRWQPELGTANFMRRWEENLAFRGDWVRIEHSEKSSIIGKEVGIDPAGRLILMNDNGQKTLIEIGDVHLRPGSGTEPGGSHVG